MPGTDAQSHCFETRASIARSHSVNGYADDDLQGKAPRNFAALLSCVALGVPHEGDCSARCIRIPRQKEIVGLEAMLCESCERLKRLKRMGKDETEQSQMVADLTKTDARIKAINRYFGSGSILM
jgi:hypothetical protein